MWQRPKAREAERQTEPNRQTGALETERRRVSPLQTPVDPPTLVLHHQPAPPLILTRASIVAEVSRKQGQQECAVVPPSP